MGEGEEDGVMGRNTTCTAPEATVSPTSQRVKRKRRRQFLIPLDFALPEPNEVGYPVDGEKR